MGVPQYDDDFDDSGDGSSQINEFALNEPDYGKAETLRYNILTYVVEEKYDQAVEDLKSFLNKDSEYPQFKNRIERYIYHCVDLVHAIRAKRHFPGKNSLTMAKQQELMARYHEHFRELQAALKKVEYIQQDLKLEDIRSTRWVVGAFVNSVFVIILMAFMLESSRGLLHTSYVVLDDLFLKTIDWIFLKLHL